MNNLPLILTLEEALKSTPGALIPITYMRQYGSRIHNLGGYIASFKVCQSMLRVGTSDQDTWIESYFDKGIAEIEHKFGHNLPKTKYLEWPLTHATSEARAFVFPGILWWVGNLDELKLYQEATGTPNYWDIYANLENVIQQLEELEK